jgi:hypothetical protein
MLGGFATVVTAHLAIVYGLAQRPPRWRALAAFALAPLAPFWALRERMFVRGGAWLLGALLYVLARR